METWREELYHYAKGSTAKDHKYIRKEGSRYIYEESSGANKSKSGIGDWLNNAANSVGNTIGNAVNAVTDAVGLTNTKRDQEIKDEIETLNKELATEKKNLTKYVNEAMHYAMTHDGVDDVYFDKDRPNSTDMFQANLKNIAAGKWSQYSYGSVFNNAVRAYNGIKNIKERIDYLNGLLKHSDTYTKELYHTAIGGTLIITRR